MDKKIKLVKDKHNWWLIDDRINIPIQNNNFIEEQLEYLTKIFVDLGYEVIVDRCFGESY